MKKLRILLVPFLGAALGLGLLAPLGASSHREAPLITEDPVADNTDVYAFRSPDKPDTVTLIANFIPIQEPSQGPNYYSFGQDVLYRINIDNNGDAVEDITYEFRFFKNLRNPNTFLYNTGPINSLGDPNLNVMDSYSVSRIDKGKRRVLATGLPVAPPNIGPRSTPDYGKLAAQAVRIVDGQSLVFAGPRDDSFFVDTGSAFDLLGLRPFNPAHKIPLAASPGVDGLSGYNVHSIAIQVPIASLTRDGKAPVANNDDRAIIGVYSDTYRRSNRVLGPGARSEGGQWQRVSRLGNPLVNEVVVPVGKKDRFNATSPIQDGAFLPLVQNPEPARLITALYNIDVPRPPRTDLADIFLFGIAGLNQPRGVRPSEMLRLNMAIAPDVAGPTPSRLGVIGGDAAGFPNGRRPADDVVDIALRALAGGTPLTPAHNKSPNNLLADGVDANDKPFGTTFPYLATPHQGYERSDRNQSRPQ